MSLQDTGTVTIKISHEDPDWATNNNKYKFGPFHFGNDLDVFVSKNSERILEIRVAFEHFWHTFSGPLPEDIPADGLPATLSWSKNEMTLSLNEVKVSSVPFRPTKH